MPREPIREPAVYLFLVRLMKDGPIRLSQPQIGAALGLSQQTVSAGLDKARKVLAIEDEEDDNATSNSATATGNTISSSKTLNQVTTAKNNKRKNGSDEQQRGDDEAQTADNKPKTKQARTKKTAVKVEPEEIATI